jgi:hypothetical protein
MKIFEALLAAKARAMIRPRPSKMVSCQLWTSKIIISAVGLTAASAGDDHDPVLDGEKMRSLKI